METPFFLINLDDLDENINTIKTALETYWPHSILSYSVKTNSLPWLLRYIRKCGIQAEVVSDEEYALAKFCGFTEKEIIFNGPAKGEKSFVEAIKKGAIVNLDSAIEIEMFNKHFKEYQPNLGVRVNIDSSVFSKKDVWYQEDGYRFGFSDISADFENAVNVLRFNNSANRIGLHFHCNSATRSVDMYKKIAEYAKSLIIKYSINPSYIDIGGGFFGGVEGKPSAPDYIQAVKKVLEGTINFENTKLIMEPGSAIIASAVDFHTSVLDTKETAKSTIVTTDGSRINIDPLWAKSTYSYRVNKRNQEKTNNVKKQIICGYTCIEHDRIMTIENKDKFMPGDEIIYEKTGAYSITFGGPFIKYFPEVYVKSDNMVHLVRKKIDVKDYYHIHST